MLRGSATRRAGPQRELVKVLQQLRRTAPPAVDRLAVVTDSHQAQGGLLASRLAMQRLQPLDDLRGNVLKYVDQQIFERHEAGLRHIRAGGQALGELLK